MNEQGALDGLKRLGLTAYEARVFLGLHKLRSGTASEISDVADVPRSQVYGATEELENRGFVERQESTPAVFRPVSLEQARTSLLDQLAQTGAETFDYIESTQGSEAITDEQTESLWQIRGKDAVSSRTADLIEDATQHILYAPSDITMLEDTILDALKTVDDAGVSVRIASTNSNVRTAVDGQFKTVAVPADRLANIGNIRTALVDSETVLLGIRPDETVADEPKEVAFWSANSTFGTVLNKLLQEWFTVSVDGDTSAYLRE